MTSSCCRYTLITPFLFFIIIHYASCQLPSSQLTAINTLQQLLQINKWNSSSNPCSWTVVSCSQSNTSITKLSLSSLSLTNVRNDSSWSSLICDIKTLQSLDLSNNRFTSIPPPLLSSCADLKVLNFSNNRLSGSLPSFHGGLQVLDLSRNQFDSAPVDSQFSDLNELKSLNLSYNSFNGPVPTNLGESMVLQELQLSMNLFDGIIPDQITEFLNLSLLDLSYNRLRGTIPSSIGQLSNLQQLLLYSNNLTGEIPQSISGIITLKRFSVNQNSLTGAIPQGITRYLSNLDLSYNNLNGSIPNDLLSQPNLQAVDLTYNNLEGFIPVNASKSLIRLRLGKNRLRGELPLWDDVPSLAYLEADNNELSGSIPSELRLYKNLSLLDLSHNDLTGPVPPELGELNKLQVVQLDHNNLTGSIPEEIGSLLILVKFNMSWNSLSGSIPSSLSNLKKLTNLDLQSNNLFGEIPDSFGTMDSLLELQLGNNKLGGVIRSLPTKLQIALNLSSNNFNGVIPQSISRLRDLEVLDLSNNRFSGAIPSFLTSMRSLTQLLLSNNMLTGLVPQFNRNVMVSFDGNPNLRNTASNPSAGWKSKNVSLGIIVASIAAVVTFVILVVAVIVFKKTHRINDEESRHSSKVEVIKSSLLTLNVIHRTNLDFAKAMECVRYASNIVLKTRFSTYYKAVMPSGMSYFVKKVNQSAQMFQLGSHDLIEQELETVGRLRNSCVMIPLAYALTLDSAYLFYEFPEKGTLFDALHGSLGNCLDWTNRYSIALGVANGLAFLHGRPSGPIILLDLSSKAIMLKSLNEPQIGDIDLSKVIDPSKSTGNLSDVAGSIGYVPPEYAYAMRVTMAGNVYSFGVILLELLTGKTAVSEGAELAKWVSTKSKEKHKLHQILDTNVSRTSPNVTDQMLAILKVALACVSDSPEARPDMRSVLRMLLNARH